jgi:hypothetical protein
MWSLKISLKNSKSKLKNIMYKKKFRFLPSTLGELDTDAVAGMGLHHMLHLQLRPRQYLKYSHV